MNAKTKVTKTESEPEVILAGEIKPIDLDEQSLTDISGVQHQLNILKEEYSTMPDVTTKEGMKLAMSRKGVLVGLRNKGDKARKSFKRKIDEIWNDDILPQLSAMEDPLVEAIKKEKDRIAEEKRVKAEVEAKRIAGIQSQIDEINTKPATLITISDIDEYKLVLDLASKNLESFAEFRNQAEVAIHKGLATLELRRKSLIEQEEKAKALAEEQKRFAEEKAEIQRQRDELEELRQKTQAARKELASEQAKLEENEKASDVVPDAESVPAEKQPPRPVRTVSKQTSRVAPQLPAKAKPRPKTAQDAENLRLYVADLLEVARPELDTDKGSDVLDQMVSQLETLIGLVDPLDG